MTIPTPAPVVLLAALPSRTHRRRRPDWIPCNADRAVTGSSIRGNKSNPPCIECLSSEARIRSLDANGACRKSVAVPIEHMCLFKRRDRQ
ncbi:hypothetical protein F3P66_25410 (plasmid) [Agrobacterium fabrum]|uniref:Uncharacterized protein n=1 Tax=Agrobacterium fabrum (strain C58 / ATCC 33970) TaxID=176299 RepID=A8WFI0_AGRFC|nr:hypothetical protein Atu8047 [Agrobacterium fabrum str. C58]QRM62705.1 hypothetical protein F3P66_25410 [Agrobacterium fabrum]TRB28168.1 hypothetical protein EXN51_16100 [Agrobacterium fabrum]